MSSPQMLQLLTSPAVQAALLVPLLLNVLDVATGVGSALRHQRFRVKYLDDYAQKNIVPYVARVLPALLLAFVAHQDVTGAIVALQVFFATYYASQVASIIENIGELCGLDGATALTVLRVLFATLFPKVPSCIHTCAAA